MTDPLPAAKVRLDRWLWAARFFKTRAQAKNAIEGGKVHLASGGKPKVGREIGLGEMLEIRRGWDTEVVEVIGLSEKRGDAASAAVLYRETPESVEARQVERARRQMQRAGLRMPQGRPDKRGRRELAKLKHGEEP
ncbi:MAG: S4 domain-containing protein [Pseudomonadales bacterium]